MAITKLIRAKLSFISRTKTFKLTVNEVAHIITTIRSKLKPLLRTDSNNLATSSHNLYVVLYKIVLLSQHVSSDLLTNLLNGL